MISYGLSHAAVVLLACVLDVSDSVAYGLDLLCVRVGYCNAEFLLKLHDELHGVKRVSTKVVGETCL